MQYICLLCLTYIKEHKRANLFFLSNLMLPPTIRTPHLSACRCVCVWHAAKDVMDSDKPPAGFFNVLYSIASQMRQSHKECVSELLVPRWLR